MADFNSEFWHWYIALLTIASILGCIWLLIWMSSGKPPAGEETMTSGHTWDGDLTELNNPMPRWWLGLFYISIAFSGFYLLLYPGLGSFGGLLEWSSSDEYKQEVAEVEARVGPLFARYQQQDIASLSQDADANRIGERLFASYCATCHGADARVAIGAPNLRDNTWLYGGSASRIAESIANGRNGQMPAHGDFLGEAKLHLLTAYIYGLGSAAR